MAEAPSNQEEEVHDEGYDEDEFETASLASPPPERVAAAGAPTSGSNAPPPPAAAAAAATAGGAASLDEQKSAYDDDFQSPIQSPVGTAAAAPQEQRGDSQQEANSKEQDDEYDDDEGEGNGEDERVKEASERERAAVEREGEARQELARAREEVETARKMLLGSAKGPEMQGKSLLELVVLAQKEGFNNLQELEGGGARDSKKAAPLPPEQQQESSNSENSRSKGLSLTQLHEKLRAEQAKTASLEEQLMLLEDGEDDVMALKAKAVHLVERVKAEKALRLRADRAAKDMRAKVGVLSDHIEKLMLYLKHEATAKARAHEQQRRMQKEAELLKARAVTLHKKGVSRERVVTELREGSKILEDQLRLMDEKYMELRTKLDYTRAKADKEVKKANHKASSLRTKFAMVCQEMGGKSAPLLDQIDFPGGGGGGGGGASGGGGTVPVVVAGAPSPVQPRGGLARTASGGSRGKEDRQAGQLRSSRSAGVGVRFDQGPAGG